MKLPSRLSGRLFKAFLAAGDYHVFGGREPIRPAPKLWVRLARLIGFFVLIITVIVFAPLVVGLICGLELIVLLWLVVFRHTSLAPRVSGVIAREREEQRYDLLSLSALGEIGATWILSKPAIQKGLKARSGRVTSQSARFVIGSVAKVLLALLILASVAGLLDLLSTSFRRPTEFAYIIVALGYLTVIAYAVRLDIEQTPTISALVGMLMPTFVPAALEAQIAAVIAYVIVQAGSYGIAIYLIVSLFQARIAATYPVTENLLIAEPADNPVLDFLMAGVYFAIFFGIREGIIWLLWRWLCRRLRADPVELDLAMRMKL